MARRSGNPNKETSRKFVISTIAFSVLGVIATGSLARADTIAHYECAVVGFPSPEPIGDRSDHNLVTLEYSCVGVDGLLKGAVYTASNTVEWDGPKGTFLIGSGVHRIPGGRAVLQMIEGTASTVMKDGKLIGNETSGKGIVKFASGPFAALSGKTIEFVTKPVNPIRFTVEFTDWRALGQRQSCLSVFGTKRTCRDIRFESAIGGHSGSRVSGPSG